MVEQLRNALHDRKPEAEALAVRPVMMIELPELLKISSVQPSGMPCPVSQTSIRTRRPRRRQPRRTRPDRV